MPIKSILVPLDAADEGQALLDAAIAVARRFDAHIDVLYVRSDPKGMLPYATLGLSRDMRQSILEAAERSADAGAAALKPRFDEAAAASGIAVHDAPSSGNGPTMAWREETGSAASVVALRGRLADLIVLPRPTGSSGAPSRLEVALLDSGRPVLVVPPEPVEIVGRSVAVAWNGSKEAAAAVIGARPFLTAAETVTVLSAADSAEVKLPPEDFATYLGWHGIDAAVRTFGPDSGSIGAGLLKAANAAGADLLVMGGYGHSRERELILGGATRHILEASTLPVLMAH